MFGNTSHKNSTDLIDLIDMINKVNLGGMSESSAGQAVRAILPEVLKHKAKIETLGQTIDTLGAEAVDNNFAVSDLKKSIVRLEEKIDAAIAHFSKEVK